MKQFACYIFLLLILLLFTGCTPTEIVQESTENHDITDTTIESNTTSNSTSGEAGTKPTTAVQTSTQTPRDVESDAEPTLVPTPTPTPSVFDVNNVKMQATPQSSCFSEIGYDSEWEVLVVRFRDSGLVYTYSDFPQGEWNKFVSADSLGRCFNKYIKGKYDYERIY